MADAVRRVYLGLGANIGDRLANLRVAVAYLAGRGRLGAISALYETAAFGVTAQPPFFNAACGLDTDLALPDLLSAVKRIEWELGRRPGERWGPRPLDIDLLLAGAETLDTPSLTVPHSGLAERGSVLVPLAEIARAVVHPRLGRSVGELLAALPEEDLLGVHRLSGPEWVSAAIELPMPTTR